MQNHSYLLQSIRNSQGLIIFPTLKLNQQPHGKITFLKCHRWPKITGWKPTADRQSRALYLEKLLKNGELAVLKWKKEPGWIFGLLGPMYLKPVSQNSGDSQAINMLQPHPLILHTRKLKAKWITVFLHRMYLLV